jgi:hypothetical protein
MRHSCFTIYRTSGNRYLIKGLHIRLVNISYCLNLSDNIVYSWYVRVRLSVFNLIYT